VIDGRSGKPVAGVKVSFLPGGFEPATKAEKARFETRTGSDGAFRFLRMPRARAYAVCAVGRFRLLRRMVGLAEVEKGPVTLRLSAELFYERLECVTPDGAPVDVSGASTTAAGAIVASSAWSRRGLLRADGLGFDLSHTPRNVLVYVYAHSIPPSFPRADGTGPRPLEIRVPGYRPAVLDTVRWPASRWPEGRRVILERETGVVRVRFAIESPPPPAAFVAALGREESDVMLDVQMDTEEGRRLFSVTAERSEITAPAGARFEIHLVGFERSTVVPFTRTVDGSTVLIQPHLPAMAFAALRYPEPDDIDPSRPGVEFQVERGSWTFAPRRVHPGVVVIGPVPPGDYLIRRIWYSGTEHRWVADAMGPVRFEEGHAVVDWH